MMGRAIDYRGGLRAAAQAASAGAAAGGGAGAGLPQWQPPRTAAQPQEQYPSLGQMRGMVRDAQRPSGGRDAAAPEAGLGVMAMEPNQSAAGGLGAAAAAMAEVPPYTALSLDMEPPGYAVGGLARPQMRARRHAPAGLIHSSTPGRADLVPARLRRGSYIIPADVVSGIGEGNTLAGARLLHTTLPKAAEMASRGEVALAAGGMADDDADDIEVRLSGGEYQVAPDQVLEIGGGDVSEGAKALDALVQAVRSHTKQTIDRMPPPK